MTLFDNIINLLKKWKDSSATSAQLNGLNSGQWSYFFYEMLSSQEPFIAKNSHLFLCPSIEEAESMYAQVKSLKDFDIYLFPGLEISPYSSTLSSESSLFQRFRILDRIIFKKRPFILICTFESFLLKLPLPKFFSNNVLDLNVSDIISPIELAMKLVEMGYSHSPIAEESGTFSHKGEVFDIYPLSHPPARLHYFDEMIEEIFPIDINTQKTLRSSPLEGLHIAPTPQILKKAEFTRILKTNIPMPASQFRQKYETRKYIFKHLSEGQLFENYPCFLPLFFEETTGISDYFQKSEVLLTIFQSQSLLDFSMEFLQNLKLEYNDHQEEVQSDVVLAPPQELYFEDIHKFISPLKHIFINKLAINDDIHGEQKFSINLSLESTKTYFLKNVNPGENKFSFIKNVLSFIKSEFAFNGHLIISCRNQNSQKELMYLFENNQYSQSILNRIRFVSFPVEEGFYFPEEKVLLISDGDLFARKKSKTKKVYTKKVDLFAEQLATLKTGDFVIHNSYGIGEYQGLETIVINGQKSDFLVLHYEDKDKVYVPVYKMNYIQKYAEVGTPVQVSSLKSKKFEQLKDRAKKSAKILAFDLLKLQAQRQSSQSFAFSPPDHFYSEFELAFPFEETPDQDQAFEDVLKDMQKLQPMDRLICGDVGFGKTEVAMRAAFKAILDKKQVAILVPTTILALQHYNSFSNRFKDFPVTIEFLSRFKTAKESKKIISDLKENKIDIIIGTHKLLAKEIAFSDLGLVIIDEEQRFGVSHKEKLKLLKSSVDFLTLTATPIPRTLQLAYLGIRDLSLIQTPPPKRQSIKSYVIKQDKRTIQQAIENELQRGGQVFFVHNRVQDIEQVAAEIGQIVPKAKIIVAHGQLPEKELEKRIRAFYLGHFNILVTTTIIESGLDIPTANTLIVNKAQNFGLSQLHQLRGRIGRSDKKAFAYFVIPKEKPLTSVANQRLEALQTYSDMGSGFSIASCDLEIRGAGDILGAEQSGHIESIGLELYTELLNEAIAELKGEKFIPKVDIEVHIPDPAFIPHNYIQDPGERLKYYKKLSNCLSLTSLEELKNEILDIFGPLPEELSNLLLVLEVRTLLQKCGLKSIKIQQNKILIKFDKEVVDANESLQKNILEVFMKRPKIYKFAPDYSVSYSHNAPVNQKDLLNFSKLIAEQIVPC